MDDPQTADLFVRLRSNDPRRAWARFLELYSPLLLAVIRLFERDADALAAVVVASAGCGGSSPSPSAPSAATQPTTLTTTVYVSTDAMVGMFAGSAASAGDEARISGRADHRVPVKPRSRRASALREQES